MDKLYKLIDEIREYGENNSVPIMSRDTITTIQNIIKENNVKTILEIGTAIGYSTICFASTGIDKIESIERDEDRYIKAVSNVEKSNLKNISLNLMDAFDFNTEDKYDLIINVADVIPNTDQRIQWPASKGTPDIPFYVNEVPTIFVSVKCPFHLADVPQVKTYINTYDDSDITLEALVQKLVGKSE